jgi:radical SAM superfamily enzyme YgiQ (UPF0313 family)
MRSAEKVVDEMRIAHSLGIREIEVYDDSFTINRQRALEICRLLRKEHLDLDWAMHTRVDLVDRNLLKEAARANCRRVNYGIESGNEGVLGRLRKNTTLEAVREAVAATKEFNMKVFGYFLMGAPGETEQTAADTVRLALSLPLDYVQFTKVVAHPGTELNTMLIKEKGRDLWLENVRENLEMEIPLVGTELTPKEVEKRILTAYRQFYFRPGYLARRIADVRSLSELQRYLRTAVESVLAA